MIALLFDLIFASQDDRKDAIEAARYAIRRHGDLAEHHTREKLKHPERRGSLRRLRLTLYELGKMRKSDTASE